MNGNDLSLFLDAFDGKPSVRFDADAILLVTLFILNWCANNFSTVTPKYMLI